jgi:hypothetical protein
MHKSKRANRRAAKAQSGNMRQTAKRRVVKRERQKQRMED